MVGAHQPHGLRAEYPRAVELAAVEQHRGEAVVIGNAAYQSAAATVEGTGSVEFAGGPGVDHFRGLAGPIGIGIDQPVRLAFGDPEARILHPQRAEDMLLEIVAQAHAADPLDRDPQHIGRHRIIPSLAGREFERQLRQLLDIAVAVEVIAREVEIVLAIDRVDIGAVLQAVGEARHMRQQIDEAHRRGRGARREGDRTAATRIKREVSKFGKHPRDRFLQRDLALFDQLHEGHRSDRLGHAGDAEQRVVAQFAPGIAHFAETGVMDRPAIARDHQLRIGQTPVRNIGVAEEGRDSRQPVSVESQLSGICQIEHPDLLSAHTYASVLPE